MCGVRVSKTVELVSKNIEVAESELDIQMSWKYNFVDQTVQISISTF